MTRTVFISHGWHDRWIAGQMAHLIRAQGAEAFVDIFDIKKGDRIEERVRDGLDQCSELVAVLTPWSVGRNWVWTELASAWISRKRFVAVLYGLTLHDIEVSHGGLACLAPTNVTEINEFDLYLTELKTRVEAKSR